MLKRLAPFLLAAVLPRLAAAAAPRSLGSLPLMPVVPAATLPGPKLPLPLITPEGVARLYRLNPPLPPTRGDDDDFTAGVTADLIPPKKPLAPAGAAALPVLEEPLALLDLGGDLDAQLARLFDRARAPELVPAP